MSTDLHTDEEIKNILKMKKVAVIGMSKYNEKAAHFVPKYLLENGYEITPVILQLRKFLIKNATRK